MGKKVWVGMLLTGLLVWPAQGQKSADEAWAEGIILSMTQDELIGQLFFLSVSPEDSNKHLSDMGPLVDKYQPGGILFEKGQEATISETINTLNKISKVKLFSGSKAGLLQDALPAENVLARIRDEAFLNESVRLVSDPLRQSDLNFTFHRALDQNAADHRFFGTILAKGLKKENVLPVFSGVNNRYIPTLIEAMTMPYEPPEFEGRKTDFSKTRAALVRAEGYDGLIMMDMVGQHDPMAIVYALKSGADVLLRPDDPAQALMSVKYALKKKILNQNELQFKVKRLLLLKYHYARPYKGEHVPLASDQRHLILRNLYRASVTLHRNENQLLPFALLDTLRLASLNVGLAHGDTIFSSYLKRYAGFHEAEFNLEEEQKLGFLSKFNAVVVGIGSGMTVQQKQSLDKLNEQTGVIAILFGEGVPADDFKYYDAVISSDVLNDEVLEAVPQLLFGALPFSGKADDRQWPEGLQAGIFTNRLNRLEYGRPVEVGMDQKTLMEIEKIAQEAIDEQATPGCQVLIARKGKVIYERSFGYHSYDKKHPVTPGSVYDLASVTKVMATTQAVMFLQEHGLINLDEKLSAYLPDLKGTNKEDLVIRDILLHQAGLRPFMPFWVNTMNDEQYSREFYKPEYDEEFPLQVSHGLYAKSGIKDSVWTWIADSELLKKKNGAPYRYRYSDMGFYMMQRLSETLLSQPLDEFMAQNYYDPLGMVTTTYQPLSKFDINHIPPTAEDQYFRKQLIEGVVHDEGAAMFGGVAGHAGLFSNANDLAKMLQMMLWQGKYGDAQYHDPATIDLFTKKQVEDNRRGLGWDKPNMNSWRSPTSEYASGRTYGHTGFTGTAVWVDPEFDLVFVFLANRIHPDAENLKLMTLNVRSRIQDVIYKSIWNFDQYQDVGTSPEP